MTVAGFGNPRPADMITAGFFPWNKAEIDRIGIPFGKSEEVSGFDNDS